MNAISGTCNYSTGNSMNPNTSTATTTSSLPPLSSSSASSVSGSPAVANPPPPKNPEDFYTTVQKHPQHHHQQQQQQQQLQHNNYYQPPPAVGNSQQQQQQQYHATAAATGLATFNGNSNLENATVTNGGAGGQNNNNNHLTNNSNYNNGNSNQPPPPALPHPNHKPPAGPYQHLASTATTPTTTSSSSSPVAVGKTDGGHTSSSSPSSANSLLSGPSGLTSAFAKKQQQQQQLHASREDVTNNGGGGGGGGGVGGTGANIHSQSSSSMNNNNNNQYQQQQQQPLQHHHAHNYPSQPMMANGFGNTSSNSQHNLNSILKGSKENLLQNSYSNGSISGSTTGSETGGGTNSSNHIEQDDPGDGLGPLPPKWETAYTERGELYFIDHNTGTSHWLDPRLSKFQKKSLEECTEGELPYGWEKIEDSLYGTYYIDHVNRKTQYENPVLEAKRRAAEQKQNQQQQAQQQAQAQQQVQAQAQAQQQQHLQRPQTPSSSSVLNGAGASIALSSVSSASTLSTVDISQRAMQPPPPMAAQDLSSPKGMLPYKFTRNPAEMQGERITTTLLKSARGLGITIVGGDGDGVEEFLQIKSIVPNGPAWLDGTLQMGDVLVYVNDTCVLGFSHHEMVNIFQSIMVGDTVTLEVCRGYPLPFDPNDPNTEVVTTIAVDGMSNDAEKQRRMLMDLNMDGNYNFLDISAASSNGGGGGNKLNLSSSSGSGGGGTLDNSGFILMKKPEVHTFSIIKGAMGFGFTIADSSYGQKVKKILDRSCCRELQEGDILLEINDHMVRNKSHQDVVQILKDCSKTEPTLVKIQRPVNTTSPNGNNSGVSKLRKNFLGGTTSIGNNALFRSKTPTADLYSTMQKEILPIRPKTPLVDTRRARVKTPNMELNEDNEVAAVNNKSNETDSPLERSLAESKSHLNEGSKSQNSLSELDAINHDIPFMDPYPKMVTSLSERLASVTMQNDNGATASTATGGYLRTTASGVANYENQSDYVSGGSGNYSSIYGLSQMPPTMSPLSGALYGPPAGISPGGGGLMAPASNSYHHHHESCFCYECQDFRSNRLNQFNTQPPQHQQPSPRSYYAANHYAGQHPAQYSPASSASLQAAHIQNERMQKRVNELLNDRRRVGFSPLEHQQQQQQQQHHHHHNTGVSSYSPSASQVQHPHSSSVSSSMMAHHGQATAGLNSWGNNHSMGYNILQPAGASEIIHHNGGYPISSDIIDGSGEQCVLSEVTLQRQALGFGFRIVGGTEEGSQVTVGHIVPGGAADNDHRITTGDEILSIDGINVVNASHHKVVSLMGEAALRGQVTMILRRRTVGRTPNTNLQQQQHHAGMGNSGLQQHQQHPHSAITSHQMPMMFQQPMMQELLSNAQHHQLPLHLRNQPTSAAAAAPLRYPYDVIVSRHENEGFGFVIISSSNQYYGSTIGKLIPGSPADRCGELKVGDRIIAVNRIDIAGMSHGDVVNLIKESGLHVRLTIGCPKEGAIINAAPTMPAGSNVTNPPSMAAATAGGGGGLLINSAQASPGQVSQTPPGAGGGPLQLLANNDNNITPYFERPLLSAGSNNGSTASSSTHMSAQQSPSALPPQL